MTCNTNVMLTLSTKECAQTVGQLKVFPQIDEAYTSTGQWYCSGGITRGNKSLSAKKPETYQQNETHRVFFGKAGIKFKK